MVSFHPLESAGSLGVTVHDGVLAESATHNIDLTTDDGGSASGFPSESALAILMFSSDRTGPLYVVDDTRTAISPTSRCVSGPNSIYTYTSGSKYTVIALSKSDGSIDVETSTFGGTDPDVVIVCLGYLDCTVHGHKIVDETVSCDCPGCGDDYGETDFVIEDSGGSPAGQGLHKMYLDLNLGWREACGDYHYSDDPRFVGVDLADDAVSDPDWIDHNTETARGSCQCGNGSPFSLDDVIIVAADSESKINFEVIFERPDPCGSC